MGQTGSRAAGYVIGVVLLVLLLLLSLPFLGLIGWSGFVVAAGVTSACALVAWIARVRADTGRSLG